MTHYIFYFLFLITYLFLIPWKKIIRNLDLFKANQLLLSVYGIEEEVFCGKIPPIPQNVHYKFFSPLLDSFLVYSRQFGVPLFNFLGEFKHHLGKDIQMERNLLGELRNGLLQCVFIGGISFGFWRWAHFFLDLDISYSINLFFALFLEVLGLIIFLIFFFVFKNKYLQPFDSIFRSYYLFWGLSSVGLPVVEVLGVSQILELNPSRGSQKILHRRVESIVNSWKDVGLPVKNAMEEAILELWNLYNERFQVFRRNLKILNFLILALFYMSAFFVLLMDFIGLFLIELK